MILVAPLRKTAGTHEDRPNTCSTLIDNKQEKEHVANRLCSKTSSPMP